jgi:hypothetical protein
MALLGEMVRLAGGWMWLGFRVVEIREGGGWATLVLFCRVVSAKYLVVMLVLGD